MKKLLTTWLLLALAVLGFQAKAQFVMPDFCTWQDGKNFVYIEDTNDWGASGINVYTWNGYDNGGWPGKANVNDTPVGQNNGHNVYLFDVPTSAPGNLIISNNGNNRFTGGNLTWTNGGYYNANGLQGVVPSTIPFDDTARKFAVTGEAVGGWNMPPANNQYFTNNGDGTYTWTGTVTAAGFKLSGISNTDDFTSDWGVFDSGLYGKSELAVGDNELAKGYSDNMTMPVNGEVTLTISNVTENSCKLNIQVNQVIVLEPAFYLCGNINSWNYPDENYKFNESNGVFTLTKTFSGQFKIRDENGSWFGTGVTFTADNNTTTLDNNNGNMTLSEESEYTLTIDPTSMLLTITGFPSIVQPVEPYATIYIDKASAVGNIYAYDQPDNQNYGGWPGTSIQGLETGTKDNVEYYVFKFTHENANSPIVIFSNGNGSQTENIGVADGDVLKYLGDNSYILNGTQHPPVVAEPYATIYIDKASAVGNIYAYDQPDNQNYGGWPGTSIQGLETGTKDNVEYYVFKFTHENASNPIVIFNEGQDQAQTANIPVADGDVLKYLGGNSYILNGVQYPLNRLYLMGLGDWDNGEEMTLGQDGKFTITKTMAAGAEFKFRDDTQWYGPVSEGNFEVTEEQVKNGTELSLTTDSGERNFTIPVAGEWTLTVDKANMNLVISGTWPTVEPEFHIAGTFTNWLENKQQMTYDSATESFSITINGITDGAEFKFIDQEDKWYGIVPESGDNYVVSIDDCTGIALVKDGGNNIKVNGSGNLTFNIDADKKLTITGWDVPGVTLADALAGQEGNVIIKSDMAVVVSNTDYAIVSDGLGNWLKVTGQSLNVGDVIYRVAGTISGLNLNPVMAVTSYLESAKSVTVTPKSVVLVTASEEEITALKANEVAVITGYYNASEGKLFANRPGLPQGKCIAVTTSHMVGTLNDGVAVSVTGALTLKEAWETPADAPARAQKNNQGYLNYTLDASQSSPATGVDDVKVIDGKQVVGIYNVNGQQVKSTDHGVYIIRYSDGTAAKVRF